MLRNILEKEVYMNPNGLKVVVKGLEEIAVEKYFECPKFLTIVQHANRMDDSEVHCVPKLPCVGPTVLAEGYSYQRNFIIPGQNLILAEDERFGLFSIVRALEKEKGVWFWLITNVVNNWGGYIIPIDKLPEQFLKVGFSV